MQPRRRPAQRRTLQGPDRHVHHRGPRLHARRRADHGHSLLACEARERPAGGEHHPLGARGAGGLEAGERLLGLARVAGAQNERLGRDPRLEGIAADHRDRARGAVTEPGQRQVAADRRAAHAAHNQPAGQVARPYVRRLGAPERVAQLKRLGEHIAEHPARVRRLDAVLVQLAHEIRSPAATLALGSIRAPAATMASAWMMAFAPTMAPGPTRARSPTRTPSASTDSTTAASAPTWTRSRSTERSTRASVLTEQWRPRTLCGPTCAPDRRQFS